MWERRCAAHDWYLSQRYVDPITGDGPVRRCGFGQAAHIRRQARRRRLVWARSFAALVRGDDATFNRLNKRLNSRHL